MRISDWSSDVCSSDLEFLNRGTNPPHCVSREAEAAIGLELLHTLHQADIAFGDQFADRQAVTAIAHGDLGHETQVRRNELRGSFRVFMFGITLCEHIFLLWR